MQSIPIPEARGCSIGDRLRPDERRQIQIDPKAAAILEALDGTLVFADLAAGLMRADPSLDEEAIARVIRLAADQDLLEEPNWLALPIDCLGSARHECLRCGTSCFTQKIGPLSKEDVTRLAQVDLRALGIDPDSVFVRGSYYGQAALFLRKLEDGGCLFLDRKSGLCRVHAAFGARAKPMPCQAFPVRMLYVPGALRVSLRSGCTKRFATWQSGAKIDEQAGWIRELQGLGFGRTSPFPRWVLYLPEQASLALAPGFFISWRQYLELEQRMLSVLTDVSLSVEAAMTYLLRFLYCVLTDSMDRLAEAPEEAEQRRAAGGFLQFLRQLREAAEDEGNLELVGVAEGFLDTAKRTGTSPGLLGQESWEERQLLRELVISEVFSLETLRVTGHLLPGLVLLAFVVVLGRELARGLARSQGVDHPGPEQLNLGFDRVLQFVISLRLECPEALLGFAQAPVLGRTEVVGSGLGLP